MAAPAMLGKRPVLIYFYAAESLPNGRTLDDSMTESTSNGNCAICCDRSERCSGVRVRFISRLAGPLAQESGIRAHAQAPIVSRNSYTIIGENYRSRLCKKADIARHQIEIIGRY
jgi:hypothetical protein